MPKNFFNPSQNPQAVVGDSLAGAPVTNVVAGTSVALPLGIVMARRRLTHAEILAGADLVFAAAPGAGLIYMPIGGLGIHENSVAGAYVSTRTVILAYQNNPTIGLTSAQNINQAGVAQNIERIAASAFGPLAPGTTFVNQPLVIHFSGGNTGGNAANFVDLVIPVYTGPGMGLTS